MKDTLHDLIVLFVDKPEDVVVTETEEDGFVELTISAAKEDMGKIIGKEGKVIRALRNLMKIPGVKQNKRIRISLVENE